MNTINIYENKTIINKVINNLNDLLALIENGNIFEIKDEYNISDYPQNFYEEIAYKNKFNIIYTTEKNPVIIFNSSIMSPNYINRKFYNINKEKILAALKKQMKNASQVTLTKDTYDELFFLELLKQDKTIMLKNIDLSENALEKIKNSYKKVTLINGNRREILSHKYLIELYTIDDLKKDLIYIGKKTTENEREINNIKLIGTNTVINIRNEINSYDEKDILNYYDSILIILDKLKKENKNNKVVFTIHNKSIFDKYYWDKFKIYNNIEFKYEQETFSKNSYDEINNQLDSMLEKIKQTNLSPYEKYISVYNIAKKFKKYKESPIASFESRKLSSILNNDYCVCVGFSNLLLELLRKVNIEALHYGTTLYEINNKNENNILGHARIMVHIKDEKYNLDGIYMADPTFDNDLENDKYTHAHFTMEESKKSYLYTGINMYDYLFDCTTFDEFNTKINHFLKLEIKNKKTLAKAFETVTKFMMETLLSIDIELYKDILPLFNKTLEEKSEKNYGEFITVFGNNILNKTNNKISEKTLTKAILSIKKIDLEKFHNEYTRNYELMFPYQESTSVSKKN